jgi:histidine ammonia-lyase
LEWPFGDVVGITAVVPEHARWSCFGDLAPLAAVALALTGEGASGTPLVL